MDKIFENVDEVLADDDFLAWYFKSDDTRANEWKNWMNQNPGHQYLVHEAVQTMQYLEFNESQLPEQEIEDAHGKLMSTLKGPTFP